MDLNYELFKGASFTIAPQDDNDTTVGLINSFSSVSKIWPVRLYSNPAKVLGTVDNLESLQLATSNLKKRADTFSTHVMGGVDKLHDEGFTGDGLFIGVIDTGVDYLSVISTIVINRKLLTYAQSPCTRWWLWTWLQSRRWI